MSHKPRLLDLFCCAGGATKGYQRAGFYVVGVDKNPQPNYCGDEFYQADALEFLDQRWKDFDAIHASPPCQYYSLSTRANGIETVMKHPHLIPDVRKALIAIGKPYSIESVFNARKYMDSPLLLCGTMFGLNVIRHRVFETSLRIILAPMSCNHHKKVVRQGYAPKENEFHCVVGHFSGQEEAKKAMGIEWMTRDELKEAIPPTYTEFIGKHLMEAVRCV